jgi:hypothetical protein
MSQETVAVMQTEFEVTIPLQKQMTIGGGSLEPESPNYTKEESSRDGDMVNHVRQKIDLTNLSEQKYDLSSKAESSKDNYQDNYQENIPLTPGELNIIDQMN